MPDHLTDYASRSLVRHLETAVSGLNDAYALDTDFDWDKKPDPSDPHDKTVERQLPYAAVEITFDHDAPFSVGNILYEREVMAHVWVAGDSHANMMQMTSTMRQSLISSVNPITSGVGVVLYNFAVASGAFFANAGTLQLELGQSQYFGAATQAEEGNKKYRSVTPITLSAFKDVTAVLLENKGRINLTDS